MDSALVWHAGSLGPSSLVVCELKVHAEVLERPPRTSEDPVSKIEGMRRLDYLPVLRKVLLPSSSSSSPLPLLVLLLFLLLLSSYSRGIS